MMLFESSKRRKKDEKAQQTMKMENLQNVLSDELSLIGPGGAYLTHTQSHSHRSARKAK